MYSRSLGRPSTASRGPAAIHTPQRPLAHHATPTPPAPDWTSVRIFRTPSGLKLPSVGFHGSPLSPDTIFGEGASGLRGADRDPRIDLGNPQVFDAAMRQHLEPADDALDMALRNDEPYYGRQFVSVSKACWVADQFAIDKKDAGETGYRYLVDLQALSEAGIRITDVNREHGRLYTSEEECAIVDIPPEFIVGAIPVQRHGSEFNSLAEARKDLFVPNPGYTGSVDVTRDEL